MRIGKKLVILGEGIEWEWEGICAIKTARSGEWVGSEWINYRIVDDRWEECDYDGVRSLVEIGKFERSR